MAKKIKKPAQRPAVFRIAFSELEYEMLSTALKNYITNRRWNYHPTKIGRNYQKLLRRVLHGKVKIHEHLKFYRKANGLVRCEYLEAEDRKRARM